MEDTVKTEHTPGKWQVEERGSLPFIWVKGVGAIAEISGDEFNRPNKAENFANARLIAAAPEMAKVLTLADELLATLDDVTVTGLRLLIDQTLRAGGVR